MSRMMRTASVAGRRPGEVALTSITFPPGSSATVSVNWPPSTVASWPAICTAASAGGTVPRTSTFSSGIVRPSSGRLSLSFTRGSAVGLGASPQADNARPAASRKATERIPSRLSAQAHPERPRLLLCGHRHLQLQGVALEPAARARAQLDGERGPGRYGMADAGPAERHLRVDPARGNDAAADARALL